MLPLSFSSLLPSLLPLSPSPPSFPSLLPSLAAISIRQGDTVVQIKQGDRGCPPLSCTADGVGILRPTVQWSKSAARKGTGAPYLPIYDSYWNSKAYFPLSVRCERTADLDVYDCGLRLPFCSDGDQFGEYQCIVTDPMTNTDANRTVTLAREFHTFVYCILPPLWR